MRVRSILVRLHRYAGLALAIFLTIAGLTGSIIAFNEELDAALNPELFRAQSQGPSLPADEIVRHVQQQLPDAAVSLVPFQHDAGKTLLVRVEPKREGDTLGYDEVFVDPATGNVQGTREWGAFAFSRAALLPFIYLLHYTLTLPDVWGVWLMGIVACIWAVDCFIGFALTLPRGKPFLTKWKTSWRVKSSAGTYRLNLDLHRAGGLWLWLLLLMMAISGVALNLPEQVFRPVLRTFATLTPSPIEAAATLVNAKPGPATITYDQAMSLGMAEAKRRGMDVEPYLVFRYAEYRAYGVGLSPKGTDGRDGMGAAYLYVDDRSGKVLAREIPGTGTPGDVFGQAQFPLHSGRLIGLPGRIIICLLGLAVAGLSVTGVYIWLRKHHLRWMRLQAFFSSINRSLFAVRAAVLRRG